MISEFWFYFSIWSLNFNIYYRTYKFIRDKLIYIYLEISERDKLI